MALAGVGWGIYSLSGRGQADALGATAWNFALAVPAGLLMAMAGRGTASAGGLALAVLSGAVTSGLGYALWYSVLPRLGATRAAAAQLTVPVLAAFGGIALLGEALTPRFVLAAALVLGGVGWAVLRSSGD
jgi:drug/metabolite transporter (DMT)-like permease